MTPRRLLPVALAAVVLAIVGWWIDPTLFWAAYLGAWWFCASVALGALSHIWIHNLTGGRWGEAIRAPLFGLARTLPLLAALFVPLLLSLDALYPWVAGSAEGAARFSGELSRPGFKSAWLTPAFFIGRSLVYLGIWLALEWITRRPRFARSVRWSAAALLIYAVIGSLAAVDWLMSLMPLWYSTVFALVVLMAQMLAGLAAAVAIAARAHETPPEVLHDLGNLLLVYVLMWAYLAFTEYLIIWAENLPHEIVWYGVRLESAWRWVGLVLAACQFFLPLLVLLSRAAKRRRELLGALAGALLAVNLINAWWLTIPSVRAASAHALWLAPLLAAALILTAFAARTGGFASAWERSDG
jgi:hypothetical protein